ncbi:hypothetical protein AB0D04_20570 [Streptomyces sp. NPDC048483]
MSWWEWTIFALALLFLGGCLAVSLVRAGSQIFHGFSDAFRRIRELFR